MKKILSHRTRIIISQSCIVLTFIVGMLLNAIMVFPILDKEISRRIVLELNRYCDYFIFYQHEVRDGELTWDILFNNYNSYKRNDGRSNREYYDGDLYILSFDNKIQYSSLGLTGNADSIFLSRYGHLSQKLINKEKKNNVDWHGVIQYNIDTETYKSYLPGVLPYNVYIRYEKEARLAFYYFFQIHEVYNSTFNAYYLLSIVFLLGTIVILIVSVRNIKKISDKYIFEKTAENSLEAAASIQESMLPKESQQYITIDIKAHIKPALKIGGDLYYYVVEKGYLYFCIGDVSGKGVPSALFMSRAVSLFKAFVMSGLSPDKIVSKMNNELSEHNEKFFFLTAFVGKVRFSDGYMEYCNAGHEAPIYWDGDNNHKTEFLKTCGGVPLGFDVASQYEMGHMVLDKNSTLILYTDGITEAKNKNNGLFGRKRLLEVTDHIKDYPATTICEKILNSVSSFVAGDPQFDDITLLIIRKINTEKKITIENTIPSLKKLTDFCESVLSEFTFDSKEKIRLRSGLDEAVTNCVIYAYGNSRGTIEISSTFKDNKIIFKIIDSGIEFNPLTYQSKTSEEITIGGLGIIMMKEIFDELKYERTDGKNILYLIKKLN